nr:hypothetical protein [Tanacetum cinerariifolium]
KWQLTVIGFFVGFKMSAPELRYHLRRMWGRFGLKDVILNTKGQCLFKFNNEEGMNRVVEQGPWGYKKVQVEYCWKPPVCTLCSDFGHDLLHCMEGSKSNGNHMEKKVPHARTSKNDKGKANTNQFSVLEEEENDEVQELNMLKDRMHVDKYLNKKVYPSKEEMSLWTADMRMYFEKQWEIDRQKEIKDAKIRMRNLIAEEKLQVCAILETHIKSINLKGIYDKVFGSWDWISNSSHSGSGCRIVVGWNNSRVDVIPIITCRECLFCAIENLNNGKKLFCSFVYAANSGIERRALWKELYVSKGIAVNQPWILLGDFNVTLKVEEHSAGGQAHAKFLPYLVSDHSSVVCCIPNGLIKKYAPFRFANYITDKKDFLPMVQQQWSSKVEGYHMFRVAKKLKLLKPYMNKINWKNRNLFDNVVKFREKLKELQTLVDFDPHNADLKKAEAVCYDEYQTAVQDECKLLHQQAKVEWLSEGDRNSAYF